MNKKIHRFLVPQAASVVITEPHLVHQLTHVLRIQKNEHIILFENNGPDVIYEIKHITKKEIEIEKIGEKHSVTSPHRNVIACIPLIKANRLEIMIEKLTELGISEIIPCLSARSNKEHIRLDRLQAISDEALEQSGGNKRVIIHTPTKLSAILKTKTHQHIIFMQDGNDTLLDLKLADAIIHIGPEGGWGPEDLEIFGEHNVLQVSLGNTVLRAETAAIIGAYKMLWE